MANSDTYKNLLLMNQPASGKLIRDLRVETGQDLRTDATHGRCARPCAPTDGGSKEICVSPAGLTQKQFATRLEGLRQKLRQKWLQTQIEQ